MNVQHFLYCTALHIFCVIEVVCLLTSCNDDANYNIHSHQAQVSFLEKDVSVEIEECPEEYEICVGERLRNPYHIEVMREAYRIITDLGFWQYSVNTPKEEPLINAFYYRVLPSNYEELRILLSDENVIYSDVPFDYQIDSDCGSYYMDPECPSDTITWLYAVIPHTYPLPEVGTAEVQVLDILHIPEEVEPVQYGEIDGTGMLEYLAYKLTGNLDEWEEEDIDFYENFFSGIEEGTNTFSKRNKSRAGLFAKTYPTGTMRVYNTDKNSLEAIEGVQVCMHNFGKRCSVITDSDGKYASTVPFRTKVRYSIRFYNEQTKTCILPTFPIVGPAYHRLGRHSKIGLDYDCYTNSKAWRYATINNVLIKNLAFNDEYDIPTPEHLNIWVIGHKNETWAGSTPLLHSYSGAYAGVAFGVLFCTGLPLLAVFLPDILLFEEQDENATTSELTETMFHELVHASHYLQVGDTYWDHYISHIIWNQGYGDSEDSGYFAGYCGIGEMWATYVGLFYLAKDLGFPILSQIEAPYWTCEQWFKPCIMIEIGNRIHDSDANIGNMYRSLQSDVHDLHALQWRMEREGINSDIIDDAISIYGRWN